MALDFPSSPTLYQIFNTGESSFIWNGKQWVGYSTSLIANYNASSIVLESDGNLVGATTTLNFDSGFSIFYNSGITTISGPSLVGYATEGYVNDSIISNQNWISDGIGINTTSNIGIGTTAKFGFSLDTPGPVRVQRGDNTIVISSAGLSLDGPEGREIQLAYHTNANYILNNIGIGTTNATSKLTVNGTIRAGVSTYYTLQSSAGFTGDGPEGRYLQLAYQTNPNYILNNVGIGTTNATSKLTVQGDVSVSGVSNFNGYVSVAGTASFRTDIGSGVEFKNASGGALVKITANGGTTAPRVNINSAYLQGNSSGDLDLWVPSNAEFITSVNSIEKFRVSSFGATVTGTTFTNQLSVGTGSSIIHTNEYGVGIGTTADIPPNPIGGEDNKLIVYGRIRSFGPYSPTEGTINGISVGSDREIIKGLFLYDDGTTPGGVETKGVSLTAINESLNLQAGVGANYNNVLINNNGVGIGTTNPTSALTVGAVGSATTSLTVNGYASINGANVITWPDATDTRQSIYIGQGSGSTLAGGYYNVALGTRALEECGLGDNSNIAIGYEALRYGGGNANVVIGANAADSSSFSGNCNVVIGKDAGTAMTSAFSNTLIGYAAGDSITTGDNNIFIGRDSGASITTGNRNVIIGEYDGNGSVSDDPTYPGYYGGSLNLATSTANIVIADGYGTVKIYINPEGNVGIATTNPTSKLTVSGGANISGVVTATAFVGDGSGLTNLPSGGESYWSSTLAGIHTLSNVGIATTNPQYKLDVGGDINFTGTLYQNGSPFSGGGGGSSGVSVQDDNSPIGTATTINFGTGLSVSTVSAGIATVTAIPTNNFYDGGIVTGNITLTSANKNQLIAVSTGSSITINLPAGSGLSAGDGFTIVDVGSSETSSGNAATFNITVTPNAADRILGGSGPLVIDENGASVKLVWMGSTYDWRIV